MLAPTLSRDTTTRASQVIDGWWTAVCSGDGLVVPDGAVDLLWSPGRAPWIAGPDVEPRAVELAPGSRLVGLRLKMGVAQLLLRDSVASATGRSVHLDELWRPSQVDDMVERLDGARSMQISAQLLASAVVQQVPVDWAPDQLLVDAVGQIRRGEELDVALSDRHLRRRFTQAMGYGTAFYRRIARLDRFTDLLDSNPRRSNSELAAAAGYFDEAHLWRDATALTTRSPSAMRSDLLGST